MQLIPDPYQITRLISYSPWSGSSLFSDYKITKVPRLCASCNCLVKGHIHTMFFLFTNEHTGGMKFCKTIAVYLSVLPKNVKNHQAELPRHLSRIVLVRWYSTLYVLFPYTHMFVPQIVMEDKVFMVNMVAINSILATPKAN